MSRLEFLRKKIDECDRELIKIFEKRMKLELEILNYFQDKDENLFDILFDSHYTCSKNEWQQFYDRVKRISKRFRTEKLFPYNIVLIGFMGTGKTTVGRDLCRKLEVEYVDTDVMIEQIKQMSISQIFEKYGEPYFRELEKEVIQEVSERNNTIIACGGGVVLNHENVMNLRKKGRIVLLQANAETIFQRIKDDISRPLLKNHMHLESLKNLLSQRKKFYEEAADLHIHTDHKKVNDISNEIIMKLYQRDKMQK